MREQSWLHVAPLGATVKEEPIRFEERPTCTVREACYAAGLGKSKMHQLISGGAVESISVGRRRLVKVPSLLKYLNAPTDLPKGPMCRNVKP